MTLVRQIALLLAMVIVTIAVSLMPSSAQAHNGHAHPHAATTLADHAVQAMPSELGLAKSTMVRAVAAAECACPSCAAGGHHGSCCFSGGLAPAGLTTSLPPMRSARTAARDLARLAGIVHEALPEPPRPFA